jgi:hypothetical protein
MVDICLWYVFGVGFQGRKRCSGSVWGFVVRVWWAIKSLCCGGLVGFGEGLTAFRIPVRFLSPPLQPPQINTIQSTRFNPTDFIINPWKSLLFTGSHVSITLNPL